MIKDMMDDQKVEVLNTYTGQSITRLWKFFTKEEREALERGGANLLSAGRVRRG